MIRYARLLTIRYCTRRAQDDERVRTEFDFVFLSILNLYFQETFIRIFSSKLNIPLKYLSSGRIEFIQLLNSETRIVMFCNYYRWTNRRLKNLSLFNFTLLKKKKKRFRLFFYNIRTIKNYFIYLIDVEFFRIRLKIFLIDNS